MIATCEAVSLRTDGPRARLERRLRWLVPGAVTPFLGVAALALLVSRGLHGANPLVLVGVLLVALVLLVFYPILAWRSAKAAATSGLHRASQRAFACSLASLTLLALVTIPATIFAAPILVRAGLAGHQPFRMLKGLVLLACVGGAAALFARASLGRLRRGASLERALPYAAADRVVIHLFDLTGDAIELERMGILAAGERLVFAFSSFFLTTERLIAVSDRSRAIFEAVRRDAIVGLGARHERLDLTLECRLADGTTRALVGTAFSAHAENVAVLTYLLLGSLPSSVADEQGRVAAGAPLEAGERVVAAAPARRDAGTVLTEERLVVLGKTGVARSLALEPGLDITVREILGVDAPWREVVLKTFKEGRRHGKIRIAARPLDAVCLLRALLSRAGVGEVAFVPSLIVHV
jgi:hypothetical protein